MSHVNSSLMDIYTENILDHNKNPRHYGRLKDAEVTAEDVNPLCGDKIHFDLKFKKGRLIKIGFTAEGCAISKAGASMLAELALGKTKHELDKLQKEKLLDLIGIPLGIARIKCGLLGFYVLKKALTMIKMKI